MLTNGNLFVFISLFVILKLFTDSFTFIKKRKEGRKSNAIWHLQSVNDGRSSGHLSEFIYFLRGGGLVEMIHSFQVSACWTKWNWWTTCETPRGLKLGKRNLSIYQSIYRTFLSTIESSWINSSLQFYVLYRFVSRRKQDYDVSESTCSFQRWFTGFCDDLTVLSLRSRYPLMKGS